MFQFSGLALFRVLCLQHSGLSHSEIFGLSVVCTYPKLIAAYHVLHRLSTPRHPPCALFRFKCCVYFTTCFVSYSFCNVQETFLLSPLSGWKEESELLSQYVKEQRVNSLKEKRTCVMLKELNLSVLPGYSEHLKSKNRNNQRTSY